MHPAVLVLMAAIAFVSIQDLLGGVVNFDGVVLANNYRGQTIQVRSGQVVRATFTPSVDPSAISLSSDSVRWTGATGLNSSHKAIAQADFKAVHPGLTTIKIRGIDTWQFGPRYTVYDVLVRGRIQPYDLALSEAAISWSNWSYSGFALRVGDDIVVAYRDGQVLTTDSSVVMPTLRIVVGDPSGMMTFRAIRAGTVQIGLHRGDGYWLPATIVVSNSSTRFDVATNDRNASKVVQIRVGQSLGVTLTGAPKYQPWSVTADQTGIWQLIDPESIGRESPRSFGFQAVKPGRQEILFRAQPIGCFGQTCADETRSIQLSLEVTS